MQRKPTAPPAQCSFAAGHCAATPLRATDGSSADQPQDLDVSVAKRHPTLKEWMVLLLVTTTVMAPAIAFSPAATFFGGIITPLVRHHQLKTRSDSLEIGRLMVAMLANAEFNRAEIIASSDLRMPAQLRALGGVRLSLDQGQGFADLSCGDRSYHFGYAVSVVGDRQAAEYRMTCYGEGVDDLVDLGVIKLDPTREQIAQRSGSGVRPGF